MTNRRLSTWFFRIVLSLLALARIFSATAAHSAKESGSDTCSLLPATQIQKILNQPFGAPQKSTSPAAYPGQPSGTECDYPSQQGVPRKIVFIAYFDPSATQAKETYEKLSRWFAPRSKPEGIGDAAYLDDNHAIHVLKGRVRYYINIVPVGTVTPEKDKQLRDLAASVAAHI